MAAQRPHWEAGVAERWEWKQGVRREGKKGMRKSERTRQGRASAGRGNRVRSSKGAATPAGLPRTHLGGGAHVDGADEGSHGGHRVAVRQRGAAQHLGLVPQHVRDHLKRGSAAFV